jgi:outer membrane lipoprotein-sorting protein
MKRFRSSPERRTPPGPGDTLGACLAFVSIALALLLAALVVPSGALAQAPVGLAELMSTLARTAAGEAVFTERRQVAMLEQTLESSGRLSFEAPDTFVRETLMPRRERVAVVGNQLTLTQGGRTRTLALDANPEAALIVEAIRGTLTGNREALERFFKASVSGDARQWRLELAPRDWRLLAQVRSITVSGQAGVVREVQVVLPDGDRSVMTIEPVAPRTPSPVAPARP